MGEEPRVKCKKKIERYVFHPLAVEIAQWNIHQRISKVQLWGDWVASNFKTSQLFLKISLNCLNEPNFLSLSAKFFFKFFLFIKLFRYGIQKTLLIVVNIMLSCYDVRQAFGFCTSCKYEGNNAFSPQKSALHVEMCWNLCFPIFLALLEWRYGTTLSKKLQSCKTCKKLNKLEL